MTTLSKAMPREWLKSVAEWRAEICAAFARNGVLRRYPRKSFVFLQGEPATAAYAIQSGRVELTVTTEAGRERVISIRQGGEAFGFAELVLGEDRLRNARVIEDAAIWVISRERFIELLMAGPEMPLALLSSTLHRTTRITALQARLTSTPARQRVASILEYLATPPGQTDPQPAPVTLRVTHEELSRLCGLTRQTVTSLLDEFQDLGLVTLRSRTIVVHDWASFEQLIDADE